jgi:hypothetical protein
MDIFMELDVFYLHAKNFSDFRCVYDKNKKISSEYDTVTLIKNAPGIAMIAGRQLMIGSFAIDLFFGAALRVINNKPQYLRQATHAGDCPQTHFAWHGQVQRNVPGGHISLGIKLGYVINRKMK